jgi:hypothetical protein
MLKIVLWGKVLRKGHIVLISAVIGAGLATAMILGHFGPGIKPLATASTPSSRNALRVSYIGELSSGLQAYYKSAHSLPISISSTPTEICTTEGTNCASKHLVDLSFLYTAGDYIEGIPEDPLGGHALWNSGFTIASLPGNQLQITATEAEQGKSIESTFQL